jgi:hypothetical protein
MGYQDLILWVVFNLGSFEMEYDHLQNGLCQINIGYRDGVCTSLTINVGFSGRPSSLSLLTMLYQFSLFLSTIRAPAAVCVSLQYPVHNHVSISHANLLSPIYLLHSRLKYFKLCCISNKFEKKLKLNT